MKRAFDLILGLFILIPAAPVLGVFAVLIFLQDFRSPLYLAPRVGRKGRDFTMIKLRSMIVGADRVGSDSTATGDRRITRLGAMVRRYKLDELAQLINVLKGDMSFVGPRPNVRLATDFYTDVEKGLLEARPGITDLASIVFSDEGEILAPHSDPELAYEQLIRPGKSRLGLFYIAHRSVGLDLRIMALTARAVIDKPGALAGVVAILTRLGAPGDLIAVARRDRPLEPCPPPGATQVVVDRRTVPV